MSGLRSANNLLRKTKQKKWKDRSYKNRMDGKKYRTPIGNKPQAKGIVLDKIGIEAKQPSSGIRKAVRVQIVGTGNVIVACVLKDGSLKSIETNDEVTIESMGRKGKSVGDRPGTKYKVTQVSCVSLDAIYHGKKEKPTK